MTFVFCLFFSSQALAVQRYREQKEEERRRRLDEMRSRDFERRQQVEERKRQLFEVEREKREAILKKNQVICIGGNVFNNLSFNYIIRIYLYLHFVYDIGTRGQNRVKKKK